HSWTWDRSRLRGGLGGGARGRGRDRDSRQRQSGHDRAAPVPAPAGLGRRDAMKYPKKLKYTREHEWVLVEGNEATVGVTDYAQHELGEVVYVELPKVRETVTKDEEFGTVESVKAASPIYAPVS